jgi:hypothetical protein
MVTRGQRRLGKTIRKLEGSVELSTKESHAKESEKKYKQRAKHPWVTRMIHQYRTYVTPQNGKKTKQKPIRHYLLGRLSSKKRVALRLTGRRILRELPSKLRLYPPSF